MIGWESNPTVNTHVECHMSESSFKLFKLSNGLALLLFKESLEGRPLVFAAAEFNHDIGRSSPKLQE